MDKKHLEWAQFLNDRMQKIPDLETSKSGFRFYRALLSLLSASFNSLWVSLYLV